MGGDQAVTAGGVIAGIGCRAGCSAEEIIALLRRACADTGREVTAIAAPAFKRHEPGLHQAASDLALPLIVVEPAQISAAQARCLTRSVHAERTVGVSSVSEGCALAAAGAGSVLVLPRIASAAATCALAEATPA
jgi:cobalt-precorrin 5A hydrolase